MTTVLQLPTAPVRSPLGQAIRTGEWYYRQLENLHAIGRLPATTFILDASKARFQREFASALREAKVEIILDTKCAELSEMGRHQGAARGAPWATIHEDKPLVPSDFRRGANADIFGQIARLAVEMNVNAVLSPTHLLRLGTEDHWFGINRDSVSLLRDSLDRHGGRDIAIDYALLLPHQRLQDPEQRKALIEALRPLPFDNLVVRLAGFGSSAGPSTLKRTTTALRELQAVGHPIVLDHVGGLIGTGLLAMGAASGIAHGVGERERFDVRGWHKAPTPRNTDVGFGRATYLPIPDFDRAFLIRDIDRIALTPKGRRLISCTDRACCPHGLKSMRDRPKAHIAFQRLQALQVLMAVPDRHRPDHFLSNDLLAVERKARDLSDLKTGDESLDKRLRDARPRVDSLARTFENLVPDPDRQPPPPVMRRVTRTSGTSRSSI